MSGVAAIIQARMGSSRLPGKVLAPIAGRPLLWHVVHRLKKAETVDEVALAISDSPTDDALAEFAEREGVPFVRGPEDDVLERYARAAALLDPEIIIRVAGDAPLVDPEFIDFLVTELRSADADFVALPPGTPCIHAGADPVSRRAFDLLLEVGRDDPVAREHVTGYFKEHPDLIKLHTMELDPKWRFNGARISVDTPDDLAFVEALYGRLGVPAGEARLPVVAELLRREPELLTINNHVRQKGTRSLSGTVVLRCDGGSRLGMGHVMRMLSIGNALRSQEGLGVLFAVMEDETARARIESDGFPVAYGKCVEDEGAWLASLVKERRAQALLLDVRTGLPRDAVAQIRATGVLVGVLDDGSERRLEADLAFYPPVPQVRALDWSGFDGTLAVGWDVVPLSPQFERMPTLRRSADLPNRPRLLLSMGGSDPGGFTRPTARAVLGLRARLGDAFDLKVVIGPGFEDGDGLAAQLEAEGADVALRPRGLADLMRQADLAVVAYGVTAFELGAIGVPAIYLCRNADDRASASAFEEAGLGVSAGLFDDGAPERIAEVVEGLIADGDALRAMAVKGPRILDRKGGMRIASRLAAALASSTQTDRRKGAA